MSPSDGARDPVDLLLQGSRQLFHPEELVAEATKDLVKEEIRRHLERKLKEDPELADQFKNAVKDLLEARAREYAALLRLTTASARLGFAAAPESVRNILAEDVAKLLVKEFGGLFEKTL